ncbi:hypothetical protein C8N37_103543 [Sphingobacterium faecium]|nr:hypothetical protein C8N37_103543 [Sphingobacterium faecium]
MFIKKRGDESHLAFFKFTEGGVTKFSNNILVKDIKCF